MEVTRVIHCSQVLLFFDCVRITRGPGKLYRVPTTFAYLSPTLLLTKKNPGLFQDFPGPP